MIGGYVSSSLESLVPVEIRDPSGGYHVLKAALDTGYTDDLTLPASMIASLNLPRASPKLAKVADGSWISFDSHTAIIRWMGVERPIEVDASEGTPLIGMRLLEGCDIHICAVPGGDVSILPLPVP